MRPLIKTGVVQVQTCEYVKNDFGEDERKLSEPFDVAGCVWGYSGDPMSVTGDARDNGVRYDMAVYFPKSFDSNLRGGRVIVNGIPYDVARAHERLMDANVPGPFNVWCEGVRVDG